MKPATFEEAVKYLESIDPNDDVPIHYDTVMCETDNSVGALMTKETWLELVGDGTFTDYDGIGDQVSKYGEIIGRKIYPSSVSSLSPDTAYILWYNK